MKEQIETDLGDILKSLEITAEPDKVLLVAVVIHRETGKNSPRAVSCYRGAPITGYAYDVKQDAYIIPCVEARELGWVNQSFYISMPFTGNWKLAIPLPVVLIERYLTPAQRKILNELKEKYRTDDHALHFVQIQGCEK